MRLQKLLKETMEIRDELANINCPHPVMTKKDVAEYLQVSVKTIENMMRENNELRAEVSRLTQIARY